MMGTSKEEPLIIGGEPRVNLLPPEVLRDRAGTVLRRRLGIGVLGSVVVVIVAVGVGFALNVQAQAGLLMAQARTQELLLEQREYGEVTAVKNHISLAQAAQQVGASTEIDWKSYLAQVQAILPPSVTIDTVTIDSASPIALYAQPNSPLQGERMATISFSAKSAVLPEVPTWLNSLATLPGFADALPDSVTLEEGTGVYTTNITMHVNSAAFLGRFAEPVAEDAAEAPAAAEEPVAAPADGAAEGGN